MTGNLCCAALCSFLATSSVPSRPSLVLTACMPTDHYETLDLIGPSCILATEPACDPDPLPAKQSESQAQSAARSPRSWPLKSGPGLLSCARTKRLGVAAPHPGMQVGIIMYLPEEDEQGRASITAKCAVPTPCIFTSGERHAVP